MEDINFLSNDVIDLRLSLKAPAMPTSGFPEAYYYKCFLHGTKEQIGTAGFRVGNDVNNYYIGNIEYEIFKEHQGNGYAVMICGLLRNLASYFNMKHVYVTCDCDNIASKKTILRSGGTLLENAKIPSSHRMYKFGKRNVLVYELPLDEDEKLRR